MNENRENWSGRIGFVLAAAASAIGLGNLWRFPYLAAQYGGGTFIVIYLVLLVTVGFTMMMAEVTIGRATAQSQLTAYNKIKKGWGFVGLIGTIVPFLIIPYYTVIGGWVLKYFIAFAQMSFGGGELMGAGAAQSSDFFGSFISAPFAPFGYGVFFLLLCAAVIVMGVRKGIEKSNLVMMPLLFLLTIGIAVYVCTLPGALAGIKYYLVPNMDALAGADGTFSVARFGQTLMGAVGQMFFSLSIAMGIMITYGSYVPKTASIEKSVRHIEFFDTLIAFLAGLMIIPMVYVFAVKTGTPVNEAMKAGPGLMFITLPKVFASIGPAGNYLGMCFFALVIFAALTSCISIYEACVSAVCDFLKISRKSSTFFVFFMIAFMSVFPAMGYGAWGDIKVILGMQFLDLMDFSTSCLLMPINALLTCILIGWVVGEKYIADEVTHLGEPFKGRKLFAVMVKYVVPVFLALLLISETCRNLGLFGWKI